MGKCTKTEVKFVIISDFNIQSNNRGTAALGYGAIAFLLERGFIDENFDILKCHFYRNPFKNRPKNKQYELDICGKKWRCHNLSVWFIEKWLYKVGLHFIPTPFKKAMSKLRLVAALNGGDGLTDIYGEKMLKYRLPEMRMAINVNIPFIVMPQTIGPFLSENNKRKILSILKRANKVYVRDLKFVEELEKHHINYERENDLSYYMQPLEFPIKIEQKSVGINISGLIYSNQFGNLKGQFEIYPILMKKLVKLFQAKKCHVYLIPHSYNIKYPDKNNDDMVATREFYESLDDKTNVIFVDKDLISPQVKYLISQMSFFVGSRMHANFAAIFTGTPVFGLAYSYKFKGAFEANGVFNRVCEINNINDYDVDHIVSIIEKAYIDDTNLL